MADVRIKRGSTLSLTFAFGNADGTAYSLTGVTTQLNVADPRGNPLASVTPVNSATPGVQTVTILSTATWPEGLMQADVAADFVAVPSTVSPEQGWLYDGSVFAAPPAPPEPTLAEQAAAALRAGIAIVSTGTPALSGTYACDGQHQGRLDRISTYIVRNGKFPAGLAEMPWPDVAGEVHSFPTIAAFEAFASAVADYVTELDAVIMGVSNTLPPAAADIP